MKTFDLYRHSIKKGFGDSNLSEAGIELASSLGASYFKEKGYTHFYTSPLQRTQDTLMYIQQGAGLPNKSNGIFLPVSESKEALALWDGPSHAAEITGVDMMTACLNDSPSQTDHLAKRAAEDFKVFADALPNESRVLVINHSPFLEIVAYGLFDHVLKQLHYLEGFSIEEQEGSFFLIEEFRL